MVRPEEDFFDRHERFYRTSQIGTELDGKRSPRLRNRYKAIIQRNRPLFDGARVLDLGSHDGRWALAALDAGAAFVLGVEARRELVAAACETFEFYGVSRSRYRFLIADVFEALPTFSVKFDLVLCLGFLYHTAEHYRLFDQLNKVARRHIILDTEIVNENQPLARFRTERASGLGRGVAKKREYYALVAIPSHGLIRSLAWYFHLCVREIDWSTLGIQDYRHCEDYLHGTRRTYVLTFGGKR